MEMDYNLRKIGQFFQVLPVYFREISKKWLQSVLPPRNCLIVFSGCFDANSVFLLFFNFFRVRKKVRCQIFEQFPKYTKSYESGLLNLNTDQHQIFPCNINVYSTPEVMKLRI